MKRKLWAGMIVLWLAFLFAFPAAAIEAGVDTSVKVYDFARLFSSEEASALSEEANRIGNEQGIDLVIVTIDDDEGLSSMDYADDFYDYNGFSDDGILMLINMDYGEVWFSTTGSCQLIFSDRRIEMLVEDTVSKLSDGNYAEAAEIFLEESEQNLIAGEEPDSYLHETDNLEDLDYTPETVWDKTAARIPIYLLIAGVAAGISVAAMAAANKTAHKGAEAAKYLEQGTVNITRRNDRFLRSTTSRVRIDHDNHSSGGGRSRGSSVHTSSSGRSHGGGGGRF